jgi:hypothetical protein
MGAIEPAAGRLGVEMAAGQDRRQARVASGPAREDVADLVDPDRTAGRLAPADEEAAGLAVEVACGRTRLLKLQASGAPAVTSSTAARCTNRTWPIRAVSSD